MTTKRERAQWANHYPLLFGKGPIVPVPEKRVRRPPDPEQPSEHQSQCAVIVWWAMVHCGYGLPEYALYAVPNGGRRNAITGARMKAEGVRRGIPDLNLDAARNQFHGLRIEMKRRGGTVSPEQNEVIAYLRGAGYDTCVCWSAQEAQDRIHTYLRGII